MRNLGALVVAICTISGIFSTASASVASPDPGLAELHFRFLGPNGNRDISVVGVPGDPNVAYFGAASGGIWKTTDGGAHFKPIFDSTDVSSVGALALAPSNPNIVWAGTGEPSIIREPTSLGDGVYKSTDAGKTWEHMGLGQTGHIDNIAINPTNPNIVFVCAIGQVYKPNPERGVYRTEDGGATWKLVLKVNDTTGCSGLSMDMQNPDTLFASTWQVQIRPWDLDSGGPDGGVFVTHDGGNTWARLGAVNGLPPKGTMIGKTAVRIAPSNDKIVYALIQSHTGLLYRSNDGGEHWTLVHKGDELDLRAPYYTNFTIAPNDENLLYFPSTPFLVSRDGGHTIFEALPSPTAAHKFTYTGGDTHDVWVDPKDPNRILTADDGGGVISHNGGKSWFTVNLPIAQIYRVHADSAIPYNVIGNRQDTSSVMGPSRVLTTSFPGNTSGSDLGDANAIPASAWHSFVGGCIDESGDSMPDPVDPWIVWSGCINGKLTRADLRTGQVRSVDPWPIATFGAAPSTVRDRWNWTFPIAISPLDHNQVFVGSQYVYETTDAGQTWKRISPDLTTDKHMGNSGGLTVDNLFTFDSATLSQISLSPLQAGVIWAGSYDGQVSVTQDGGTHWTNVTANIKGLPPYGTINLQASPFDACGAIVSSDLKEMGDYNPYIFQTDDCGKTWKNISGDIPHSEFSFVHVVREDPVRKGMLYAGTENDLYISWDDGSHWTQLKGNFPPAPVYWLTIQQKFNDLVIATYGRGIWVLDDITPLRSWDTVSGAGDPHLFDPRPAYRFRVAYTDQRQDYPNGIAVGENIPYGADLNYYLPSAEPVSLTITNSEGKVVRVLKEQGKAGLNRVWWALRTNPIHSRPTLLNNPLGKPWVTMPAKGRPLVAWQEPTPPVGPLVVPGGAFTVSLNVNGASVGSAPLQVLPDPKSIGTLSGMQAMQALQLQMVSEINQVIALINHFEVTRKRISTLAAGLGTDSKAASMRKAAEELQTKAIGIESRLFDIYNSGESEDNFRAAPQLYEKLGSLYNNLNSGNADQAPTASEIEANNMLRETIASVQQQTDAFNKSDLPKLDELARADRIDNAIKP